MPATDIRTQLKQLLTLQNIDAKIYELKRALKEKPEYLQEVSGKFEAKKETLKALEEKLKKTQLDRKAKEGDLAAKDDAIAKASAQLAQLKTNKEYTAKISEIEGIKADKSIIEEHILISYDESDKIKADTEREKTIVAEAEKDYLGQKQTLEKEIKDMEGRIQTLAAERKQILPQIDKGMLSRYEKILENKDGLAMVPVDRASCGGCYMNIPPQVVNEIKMHETVIHCEMCSRILYLPEDLDA